MLLATYVALSLVTTLAVKFTEHVYEKNMVGTFLRWLLHNDADDDEPLTLLTPVSDCMQINSIWGQVSTTPNSPFAAPPPLEALALSLSDNMRAAELFMPTSTA